VDESSEVRKTVSSSTKKSTVIFFAFSVVMIALSGFVLVNHSNFFSTLDGTTVLGVSSPNVAISIAKKNDTLENQPPSISENIDEFIGKERSVLLSENCDAVE